MPVVWEGVALATLLGSLVATTALVRRALPSLLMPFAAAVGLAGLVWFETVVLTILSMLHGVARYPVLTAHLGLIISGLTFGRARSMRRLAPRRLSLTLLALAPLFCIIAVSALRYPPNTTDSMTYHLSRIAYWMKFQSVAPFPTYVDRQIATTPGAEYLIALPQIIGDTDRWAALVQFIAYSILVACTAPLARLAGAPARIAALATVIVATIPIVVLNASSTGNDIVAATLAIAIIVLALRAAHVHHGPARPLATAAAAGMTASAAALTKVTAVIVAAPAVALVFVAVGLRLVRTHRMPRWRAALATLASGVVPFAALVPEVIHRSEMGEVAAGLRRSTVFDVTDPLVPRLWNALQGFGYHISFFVWPLNTLRARHDSTTTAEVAVLLMVACCVVGLARLRRTSRRTLIVMACLFGSWALFSVTIRHFSTAIGRTQTPLIVVGTTASLAVFHRIASRTATRAISLMAALALVIGYHTAVAHRPRPPFGHLGVNRDDLYYLDDPAQGQAQNRALQVADEISCKRIGLLPDTSNTFDYPLVWRGRSHGIDVRQVAPDSTWPCMFFSTGVMPAPREGRWVVFEDQPVRSWGAGGPVTTWRPVLFARIGGAPSIN